MVEKGSFLGIFSLSCQEQHVNRWGECFFTNSTVEMPGIGFSLMSLTLPRYSLSLNRPSSIHFVSPGLILTATPWRFTVRGRVHFSRDKVRIRQIAQTVHSSFGRENCPCPPHVARVAGNDREIERRVTKPQRRKEEGKAKSDLRFWYSWRPRVPASWR